MKGRVRGRHSNDEDKISKLKCESEIKYSYLSLILKIQTNNKTIIWGWENYTFVVFELLFKISEKETLKTKCTEGKRVEEVEQGTGG